MTKRWSVILAAGFCVISAWACAKDRAGIQLARYVNQGILNIAELEQRPLAVYASVTGNNYTSDGRVAEVLGDFVIPYYGRYLDRLRDIRPETDELKQIHRIYLEGVELIYTGFRMKLAGIEAQDSMIIRAANESIEKGRIKSEEWRNELLSLYTKYGAVRK